VKLTGDIKFQLSQLPECYDQEVTASTCRVENLDAANPLLERLQFRYVSVARSEFIM